MTQPTCPTCSTGIVRQSKNGPTPTYCSRPCRQAAYRSRIRADGRHDARLARRRAERKPTAHAKTCERCKVQFSAKRSDQRFCSVPCSNAGNLRRCSTTGCGLPHRAKGLCSTHYNELTYGRSRHVKAARCEHCGADYEAMRPAQRFCSLVCRNGGEESGASDAQRAQWRDQRRRRRAAEQRTPKSERFNESEIYERDRWICGVCRRKVDRAVQWPDLQCPSIDHIVPLVEGGEHTRANVRLAHLGCNIARGHRGGGEQLALM